jgi:CheY-like chemotaxis protein/ribosome-associated translation inhibitor RaiA
MEDVVRDAPFSIKYEAFEPDEQLETYIQFLLYKVIDYCSYDSFVHLHLVKMTERYFVDLSVKYIYEDFHGLGEDANVEVALEAAEKSICTQIKKWKSSRFSDQRSSSVKKIKVLVVDDDPISTKLIESCLHEQGCEVSRVSSGDEAVFSLKARHFNFVVMDWNMYPLSGRQTIKILDSAININKGIQRDKIPILTYSINNQENVKFPRAENLYQFAHLSKKSSINRTFEITKKLIQLFNASGDDTQPRV